MKGYDEHLDNYGDPGNINKGHAGKRRAKHRRVSTTPKAGPVTVIRKDPKVLAMAQELAKDRDVHLLFGNPDGSILIVNGSRK